jgi:hypothetical protein
MWRSGGASARLAAALWLIIAARALATIPFVRTQIARLRHGSAPTTPSDLGQAAGVAMASFAIVTDQLVVAGALSVMALAVAQLAWVRRTPIPAKRLGLRLLFLGFAIVGVTAAGVHLA